MVNLLTLWPSSASDSVLLFHVLSHHPRLLEGLRKRMSVDIYQIVKQMVEALHRFLSRPSRRLMNID